MKINLLREDQMTKVPHQNKEKDKEVLRFDDTFSGGNDDFYFQQPPPPAEEFKKPRKFRFWLFLLILIIVAIGGAFIAHPRRTTDLFTDFGKGVAKVWNKTVDKIETFWLHRNDEKVVYIEEVKQPEAKPESKPVIKIVEEVKADIPPRIIKVEKPIEKEVVKESTEEKILESPPIYDKIRDELAISRRNMIAAEFVWSKVPGGMIMDKFTIIEDEMTMVVRSRYSMLIQSYSNVIEQHDMFTSIELGKEEEVGELTRAQLNSDLPSLRKEDRPERIWDLDLEWFDDYLVIAANNSDVVVSQDVIASEKLESNILEHVLKVSANGNRTSMMEFLQEVQAIPAAFVVKNISSTFDEMDQSNLLELTMVFYERE